MRTRRCECAMKNRHLEPPTHGNLSFLLSPRVPCLGFQVEGLEACQQRQPKSGVFTKSRCAANELHHPPNGHCAAVTPLTLRSPLLRHREDQAEWLMTLNGPLFIMARGRQKRRKSQARKKKKSAHLKCSRLHGKSLFCDASFCRRLPCRIAMMFDAGSIAIGPFSMESEPPTDHGDALFLFFFHRCQKWPARANSNFELILNSFEILNSLV